MTQTCASCGGATRTTSSGHALCDDCGAVMAPPAEARGASPAEALVERLERERDEVMRQKKASEAVPDDAWMEAFMKTLVGVTATVILSSLVGVLVTALAGSLVGLAAGFGAAAVGFTMCARVWRRARSRGKFAVRARLARIAEADETIGALDARIAAAREQVEAFRAQAEAARSSSAQPAPTEPANQ